jgi:hypothetical protein
MPPSSPSYVPTPYTYDTPSGDVTFSYIPTSTGYTTYEYNTVKTPSGYVTYVDVPTTYGFSEYTESTGFSVTP